MFHVRLLINTNSSVILYEFSSDDKTAPKNHDPIFEEEPKSRLRSASNKRKEKLKSKKASSVPLPAAAATSSPPEPYRYKKAISSAPPIRTATSNNDHL